ncbi:hypothetical protein PR202_gb07025 [Eleusine coracana subsp. coracana]|uniref:Uncharacterized protein n=1 Tax=Eleusine coracana subsp. coracana TaxID=191504 RepID=A0AAV5E9B8_ELECO|nr:hypothetical protein PR202_gb07025 [Eleusine coracana subsp. coracana]
MTMASAKNNLKQHNQQQVALPVVFSGMGMAAAPCLVRSKLLLCAAVGFALGVAVTVSFLGSSSYTASTVDVLRGGALELFFPAFQPSAAAATANLSPDGVVRQVLLPPTDTGVNTADAAPPPPVTSVVQVQQSPPADNVVITPPATPPPPPPPPAAIVEQSAPANTGGASHGGVGNFIVVDDEELLARAASAPRAPPGRRVAEGGVPVPDAVGPADDAAVGEVLRGPRRALLRLRAHRPGVQRHPAAAGLRLLPPDDPQQGAYINSLILHPKKGHYC